MVVRKIFLDPVQQPDGIFSTAGEDHMADDDTAFQKSVIVKSGSTCLLYHIWYGFGRGGKIIGGHGVAHGERGIIIF